MEQELIYKKVAVIGCGAAGGFLSVLLLKNPMLKVYGFDVKEPFSTLLPTGGGRCNITYDEPDISELVKNYPRGEKFLLSVFSRCNVDKTRKIFSDLGIETYVQEDKRIFPVSNSSEKTVNILKKHLESPDFIYKKEKVISVEKKNGKFSLKTDKKDYEFDYVVFATGGKGNGCDIAHSLGHNIISLKPSLTSLDIKEKIFYNLSGYSIKNAEAQIKVSNKKYKLLRGDILFTHKSISGPLIFKISALKAFDTFDLNNPAEITFNLTGKTREEVETEINKNSKKNVKNVFSKFISEKFINDILILNSIDGNKQCAQLKKTEKEILINSLIALKLNIISGIPASEIVSAGGVDLNEIDSKTMQSKLIEGLYFAGEMINVDGFTGGFNLQNCWSTAYIVSININ